MDFVNVNLDLFSYCNASCSFCGYNHMTRKRGAMSDEIFHKVIDEISTWTAPVRIMPYLYGEPLMNGHLFEQCAYISEKLPQYPIEISTNGSYLWGGTVDSLIEMKTLRFINFSVYAGTKETYERILGLDYETIGMIEETISRFKEERPEVYLCVGATDDKRFVTELDVKELQQRFGDLLHLHPISFSCQHQMPEYIRTTPDVSPCPAIQHSIIIYWDGRIGMCCFDVNGDLVVGNVNKTTIAEAANSDLARKYRCAHSGGLKDVIELCRTCTQPQ